MEKPLQLIGMFFYKSFLFFFDDVDSPNFDKSFLFFLLSLSFLRLSVLIELYLPQSFYLSFMLLFFHSTFLPCQKLKSFLLCKPFQHFLLELLLKKNFLLLLSFFCIHMLCMSFLQQLLYQLSFLSFFSLFFLVLFFLHVLVVLNTKILQLLNLFSSLIFCLLQSQINHLFFFFFSRNLLSLHTISLIKSLLIL